MSLVVSRLPAKRGTTGDTASRSARYSAPVRWRARALFATWLATCGLASAGGVDSDDTSPRSIGRAGAMIVSDDAEGALLWSPASLARRSETRLRLGLAFRERDLRFNASGSDFAVVRDSSGPTVSPSLTVATELGPFVIAGSYLEPSSFTGELPSPAFGQPPEDIERLFPHRYNGLRYSRRTRELRVGAAMRLTEWLAAGISLSARRLELSEDRTLWAGFSGRDGLANPALDLELRIEGSDSFAPGGGAGFLLAPIEVPIEIAAAFSYARGARVDADALAIATQPGGPGAGGDRGSATLELPDQMIVTAGVRAAHGIVAGEVGAIVRLFRNNDEAPSWRIDGIEVTDQSGLMAPVSEVPSQWSGRQHTSVLGSIDVEVLGGFLWLTGGYRYQQAATSKPRLAPSTADLGGHTLALGAEVYVRGITATIGYSRSFVSDVELRNGDSMLINPFDGGTEIIGLGNYERTDDRIGISVELSLEGDDDLGALP